MKGTKAFLTKHKKLVAVLPDLIKKCKNFTKKQITRKKEERSVPKEKQEDERTKKLEIQKKEKEPTKEKYKETDKVRLKSLKDGKHNMH